MKSQLLFATVLFVSLSGLAPIFLHAQIGMGTTTPDAHAILDLHNNATPRGLLLPRMSTAARTTLGSSMGTAQAGLMVADTSAAEGGVYVWDGTEWANLNGGGVVNGSGTVGYLNRWTATGELGNSVIRDDGTSLGIGVNPNTNSLFRINSARQTTIDILHAGGNPVNFGVRAIIANDFGEKIAIYGESSGATGDKIGLRGIAGGGSGETNLYGVYASATNNNGSKHGIRAEASGAGTVNRGILTSATGAATQNYGIHSSATGGTTNWAGFFEAGNVHIQNNLGIGTVAPQNTLHVNGGITATGMSLLSHAGECKSTQGPSMSVLYRSTLFIPPGTHEIIILVRGRCNGNHDIQIEIGGVATPLISNIFSGSYGWASPGISIVNPQSGYQELVISGQCPPPPGNNTLDICEFNILTK